MFSINAREIQWVLESEAKRDVLNPERRLRLEKRVRFFQHQLNPGSFVAPTNHLAEHSRKLGGTASGQGGGLFEREPLSRLVSEPVKNEANGVLAINQTALGDVHYQSLEKADRVACLCRIEVRNL